MSYFIEIIFKKCVSCNVDKSVLLQCFYFTSKALQRLADGFHTNLLFYKYYLNII